MTKTPDEYEAIIAELTERAEKSERWLETCKRLGSRESETNSNLLTELTNLREKYSELQDSKRVEVHHHHQQAFPRFRVYVEPEPGCTHGFIARVDPLPTASSARHQDQASQSKGNE